MRTYALVPAFQLSYRVIEKIPILVATLLGILIFVYGYREITKNVLVIELFNAPKQYTEMGLTGEVLANHVGDELCDLERETLDAATDPRLSPDIFLMAIDASRLPDIEIPATKLGLNSRV